MPSRPYSLEAADIKEMETVKQIEDSGELTWTPEEEKKLVRKVDLFLLPTIWLMYLLSYMDRTKFVHPPSTMIDLTNVTSASAMRRLQDCKLTFISLRISTVLR